MGSTLAGRSVLIVEDERLTCLDLEQRMQEAGAKAVIAGRLDRALQLADDPQLSAAVLDFHLDKQDTSPVCQRLVERGVPFLFYSGALHRAYPAAAGCADRGEAINQSDREHTRVALDARAIPTATKD